MHYARCHADRAGHARALCLPLLKQDADAECRVAIVCVGVQIPAANQ